MKTWADVEGRLNAELVLWFERQNCNILADFYLYYYPSSVETDGGLLIAKEPPVHGNTGLPYKLVMAERMCKSATIEQNFNWIMNSGVLNHLPLLSI